MLKLIRQLFLLFLALLSLPFGIQFDNTLLFFDLDSYKNTNIIDSILCSWNNSLYQSDEAHLFIGGYNQISVYNINSNQIISIIEGTFGEVDSFISFGDDCILYGCGDGSLCVI